MSAVTARPMKQDQIRLVIGKLVAVVVTVWLRSPFSVYQNTP